MNGVASTPQTSPSAALRTERMSRVDTAWLRMDNDVNLMMIVGVWLLTPAITLAALRERIASKLLQYDRFRQKAVVDGMGASWVDDEAFDIENHVLPLRLQQRRPRRTRQTSSCSPRRLRARHWRSRPPLCLP
jgi:hypothetical protein